MVLVTHDQFSLVLGSRKLPKNCNLAVSDIVWVAVCSIFSILLYTYLFISICWQRLTNLISPTVGS